MTQLDIFQSAQPRDARQAIKTVLTSSPDPVRELCVLISLWHDYTWPEVEGAINRLLEAGEIIIAGTWRGQMPESWSENIYAMAERQEAAA